MHFPKTRWGASGIHFLMSLLIFLLLAVGMYLWWFPGALFSAAGGWDGVMIVAAVDFVLGPLITLVIYDLRKPIKELCRDLGLIFTLQMSCLMGGVYVVSQERPVAMVYVFDTFYSVQMQDLKQLDQPDVFDESFFGPKFFYVETALEKNQFLVDHVKTLLNAETPLQYRLSDYQLLPKSEAEQRALYRESYDEQSGCYRVDIETGFNSGSICFIPEQNRFIDFRKT